MSVLRDESFYYQYEYKGGTVEMPKEVFWELYNDSKEEIEKLKKQLEEKDKEIKFLKQSIKVFTDKWDI